MALGQRSQALLTILYCSTDCLSRCGAAVKNLAHSASFHCLENNAPSNPGIKHLSNTPDARPPAIERGGLAGWQRRIVCDFINDNLDRDISLEELAALAKLSPTHFCRSFTRSLGMPPHQYQVRQRVEHAKQLLAEPDRTITEVAIAAG